MLVFLHLGHRTKTPHLIIPEWEDRDGNNGGSQMSLTKPSYVTVRSVSNTLLLLGLALGLLAASAPAADARSVSLTGASVSHYLNQFGFQNTKYEADGNWYPDTGDTVRGVILERAPSGTDEFSVIDMDSGLVDIYNQWYGEGHVLHDGSSNHVRGGIEYRDANGVNGVKYSSKSSALSCEP